jgi:hypothetical protein
MAPTIELPDDRPSRDIVPAHDPARGSEAVLLFGSGRPFAEVGYAELHRRAVDDPDERLFRATTRDASASHLAATTNLPISGMTPRCDDGSAAGATPFRPRLTHSPFPAPRWKR